MSLDNLLTSPALAGMRSLRQWMIYTAFPDPKRPGKLAKLPMHPATGMPCSVVEPANWTDAETAAAAVRRFGQGFGLAFCFTETDPYWFIDLDGCKQADGSWSPLAQQLVTQVLPGAALEVSASGNGLHLFGRGAVPPHASKNIEQHAELYTGGRFCAMTGTALQGDCDTDHSAGMAWVVATYFAPKNTGARNLPDDGPVPEWRGPTDDAELLRRMLRSSSAGAVFSGKASFADLWDNNVEVLHRSYPGDGEGGVDRSSADAALAQLLAFWTGKDQARMISLMQQSALVRPKWEDREDYLPRTVANACGMRGDVLQDKPVASPLAQALTEPPALAADSPCPAPPELPTMAARVDATFLSPDQAAELFKGCVYVVDPHRVLIPGGRLLKPDQFKAVYGGRAFAMDTRNERTTRNAFEAFTESQALRPPVADGTCFKPRRQPGEILTAHGRRLVNTWDPANVDRVKGDPGPFLRHLALLLPDDQDRAFLLYYLANMVQHPGEKFSWAPVIQGVEGNGKSFISKCLTHALGARYVYAPRADKITKDFNAWMAKKLAIVVEDIKLKNADLLEQLKPLITEEAVEIEGKGVDQEVIEICANWLFNSNHRDGIRKTRNDRRYMILWCAQQAADDLERYGMGPAYFTQLHRWAKDKNGFAIVADYLATMPIPEEFGLQWVKGRAPRTSSTTEAIEANRTPAEMAVLEAVDAGMLGFKGEWISTVQLRKLLEGKRLLNDCREASWPTMLEGLDFVIHPGLGPTGQVDNPVLPDQARPKLYVRKGSSALAIQRRAEIARAYTAAQGVAAP